MPYLKAVAWDQFSPRFGLHLAVHRDIPTPNKSLRLPARFGQARRLERLGQRNMLTVNRKACHATDYWLTDYGLIDPADIIRTKTQGRL
jgi:hypothetical protein